MSAREEKLRSIYDAWNRGDTEEALAQLDPAIECKLPDTGMNTGTYRGHEGVRDFLTSYLEVFEFFRIEPQEFAEEGERLTAAVQIRARGRGSGVDVELRPTHVWTFRGTRLVRLEVVAEGENGLK
jgi:ketosteroid isomerase-like protein